MKSQLRLAVFLALAGCTSSTGKPAPPAQTGALNSNASSAAIDAAAPLFITLEGPDKPQRGQDIDVSLVIRRTAAAFNPMTVVVTLPPNAELLSGALAETIDDASATKWVRPLRLHLHDVPASDVIATVDVKRPGFGVHATAAYRFGRAAPKLSQPPRGAEHNVNGVDIGGSIPLGATTNLLPVPPTPGVGNQAPNIRSP